MLLPGQFPEGEDKGWAASPPFPIASKCTKLHCFLSLLVDSPEQGLP